jgi:hypothetical protein
MKYKISKKNPNQTDLKKIRTGNKSRKNQKKILKRAKTKINLGRPSLDRNTRPARSGHCGRQIGNAMLHSLPGVPRTPPPPSSFSSPVFKTQTHALAPQPISHGGGAATSPLPDLRRRS